MFLDPFDNLGALELAIVCAAALLVFGRRLQHEALGLLDRWLGH